MSEENDEGSYPEEKPKKVVVEHRFIRANSDGETEEFTPPQSSGNIEGEKSVEERARNAEAKLAALALAEFAKSKNKLLDAIEDPERREAAEQYIGTNPQNLETARFMFNVKDDDESDGREPLPPKGKARSIIKSGKDEPLIYRKQYDQPVISEISKLYETMQDPEKSQKEKDAVEAVLQEFFDQAQKGVQSRPKGSKYMLPMGVVMHCPACGMVVEVDLDSGVPCPHCGYTVGGKKLRPYKNPV